MFEVITQPLGNRQHPVTDRQLRKNVVGEMGGGFDLPPGVASGTDTTPLAVDPIRLCRQAARWRESTLATAALSSSDGHAIAQCTVHTMHGSNDRTTC